MWLMLPQVRAFRRCGVEMVCPVVSSTVNQLTATFSRGDDADRCRKHVHQVQGYDSLRIKQWAGVPLGYQGKPIRTAAHVPI